MARSSIFNGETIPGYKCVSISCEKRLISVAVNHGSLIVKRRNVAESYETSLEINLGNVNRHLHLKSGNDCTNEEEMAKYNTEKLIILKSMK